MLEAADIITRLLDDLLQLHEPAGALLQIAKRLGMQRPCLRKCGCTGFKPGVALHACFKHARFCQVIIRLRFPEKGRCIGASCILSTIHGGFHESLCFVDLLLRSLAQLRLLLLHGDDFQLIRVLLLTGCKLLFSLFIIEDIGCQQGVCFRIRKLVSLERRELSGKTDALKAQHGVELDKRKIELDEKVTTVGQTTISVKLYAGVSTKMNLVIEAAK